MAAFATALYAASWSGGWTPEAGGASIETFSLDVDRFGLSPACYWVPDPDRLAVVPAALVPWPAESASGAPTGEVLVVELGTGRASWRPSSRVESSGARHVFWDLRHELEVSDGREILYSDPRHQEHGAVLSFAGFGISVPAYSANFPPFGEPGWGLERRRFGRWRLTAGDLDATRPDLALTLSVVNSSYQPDLSSLAAWLPGGRFLLLMPKSGRPRLLLAGPFPPGSQRESLEDTNHD